MSMTDPKGSRESLEAMAQIRAHRLENQPRQASFIPGIPGVESSNKRPDNPEESYG
jgi:hypothetical protein